MAANMTQVKTLCVVKVAGDGNCLFHALALHEGIGGAELKTEVIDHMDIMAEEDSALREAWHGEAGYLRGPEQSHWGGHMAIIAYSAMRQRRVMVHEKPYDGDVKVDEQSHPSVAGKDTCLHSVQVSARAKN